MLLMWTGWRTTYLILGLVVLLLAAPIAAFILRNDPSDMGLLPDGDQEPPQSEDGRAEPPQASRLAPLEPERWHGAFVSGPFWLLIGSFFVCGFSVQMVTTHFVPFVTDRGISPTTAATALGLLGGCDIAGTLLAGVVPDRIGRKTPLSVIYL